MCSTLIFYGSFKVVVVLFICCNHKVLIFFLQPHTSFTCVHNEHFSMFKISLSFLVLWNHFVHPHSQKPLIQSFICSAHDYNEDGKLDGLELLSAFDHNIADHPDMPSDLSSLPDEVAEKWRKEIQDKLERGSCK